MTTIQATSAAAPSTTSSTRALLTCTAVAAPLWAIVSLTQAATRAGFDLTRHPLSALSNGDLGWLQITNFVVAGLLTVVGATGLRRVMHGSPGGRWTPRLVRVCGIGWAAAGGFVMEPIPGFPVGTPATTTMGVGSLGHMAAGSLAFIALAAACYVLGHHFGRTGHGGLAAASRVAGTAVVLGDGWAMTGGPLGSLTLAVGVIAGMLWISAVAARFRRTA